MVSGAAQLRSFILPTAALLLKADAARLLTSSPRHADQGRMPTNS